MSAVRNQYQYTSSGLTHLAVGFKAVAQPGRGARAWDKPKKTGHKPRSGALMCVRGQKESVYG